MLYTKKIFMEKFIKFIDHAISLKQIRETEKSGHSLIVSPMTRKKISSEYTKHSLKCCFSSWRRISDQVLSPKIKCGANYINSRLGQREALRNGYDTCIFLNDQGKIAEGPGSCFFMVKDNVLITPKVTDSILNSITRDTIIKIAEDNNYEVQERSIDRTEAYICDEAFLCGSSMGITSISQIDGIDVPNHEVTDKISDIMEQILINVPVQKLQ